MPQQLRLPDPQPATDDYNIGLELLKCYDKSFDHRETQLNELVNTIKKNNIDIKVISDLMNRFTNAKPDKKADFSKDENAKKCLYLLHLRNPTVLGEEAVTNRPAVEKSLSEIVDEMMAEGIPLNQITLPAVLERVNADHIQFPVFSSAEDIDVVTQGLEAELKMLNADQNELMLKFSSKTEDRSTLTENARRVLQEANDLIKSINANMRGR